MTLLLLHANVNIIIPSYSLKESQIIMGNWTAWKYDLGLDVEYKFSNSGNKIIIKAGGQDTNYPHWTGELVNGKCVRGHGSVSKRGERFGSTELIALAAVLYATEGPRDFID